MKSWVRLLMILAVLVAVKPFMAKAGIVYIQEDLIGKSVPDFTLKDLSGNEVNFTKYRDGKKAIVFFWATWCPHCRKALKELNEQAQDFVKKDIQLVLIDLGENSHDVNNHILKNKITLGVLLDEKSALVNSFGLVGVPTFYFVDTAGVVKSVKHELPSNYEKIF